MKLLRRIARRLVHEFRGAFGPRPEAGDAIKQLADERKQLAGERKQLSDESKLSAEHRWVASVAVANLKDKAAGLSSRLDASAEGRAGAALRTRDVADFVRFGGGLPPR